MQPTQQHIEEADRVDLVYQYVLSVIAAKVVADLLAQWQDVPVGATAKTMGGWLTRAARSVIARRTDAQALGLSYYRLARALRTGATIHSPVPAGNEGREVSLERLRQEFEAEIARQTGEGTTQINADLKPGHDDDAIGIEPLAGLDKVLKDDAALTESYLGTVIGELLDAAALKIDSLPDTLSNLDAKASAKDIHDQHAAMVAAAGARIAMNGARNATNQASMRDPRVIGWVRQSSTGSPCYWCAMLISRRVLYKSKASAGGSPDAALKFHDNCHCVAEPVYSDAGFDTNPKYAENRRYADLWDRYIKDKYSGDEAILQWRKLIAKQIPNADAQAAAA